MYKIVIKNLSKTYQLEKNKYFHALSNVNLKFGDYGFVGIVGKSGSGKSTLLNMISQIDNPSSGEIYINGKKVNKNKRDNYAFYRDDIGIVFQNYQLIEDRSCIYNVALPLIINGWSKRKAFAQARLILDYVNLKPELSKQLCSKLSGGEKQRVAIARAIINNQSIILCDEPTGALDSSNSKAVLELLKKISLSRLVIIVSHNLQDINTYCNRKIELCDGKVINDIVLRKASFMTVEQRKKMNIKSSWTSSFSFKNFRKRIKRNVFVIVSISVSLIMGNLVFGFIYGKDESIRETTYRQFDFGYGTISKDEVVSNTGVLKLTKTVRPELELLQKNEKINKLFEICPNFLSIMPLNPKVTYDGLSLEGIDFTPIYTFDNKHIDNSIITQGYLGSGNNLNEVIINNKCYDQLKKVINKNPLYETISISHHFECNYILENEEFVTDTFTININCKITGVCDEMSYLASSKIYYSYLALESYMQDSVLINLSTYNDNKITWYDRVVNAENYSYISAYSYQLFLKDYKYRDEIYNVDLSFNDISFTSNSLIIAKSLSDFLQVAEYALFLFLSITMIGAILILSIISFTNFCEDRKTSAILSIIGAKNSDIENIYVNESLISGLISLVISICFSIPLSILINNIIFKYVSIKNIVQIPFLRMLNIPFAYPLFLLLVLVAVITFASIIPIKFSQFRTLKQELLAND